jgi:hypothetical protein
MKTHTIAVSAIAALLAAGRLDAATATTAPPDPSPYVVAPPAYYALPLPANCSTNSASSASFCPSTPTSDAASSSATFQAALIAWSQMVSSEYGHEETWFPTRQPPYTAANPQYLFDCVGALSYILNQGAPQAMTDVFTYMNNGAVPPVIYNGLNGGHGTVPPAISATGPSYASYFVSLNTAPSPDWQLITTISAIQPGDVLIVPASFNEVVNNTVVYGNPAYPGHAMLAAGAPMLLSDGSYALAVFDSTSIPGAGGKGGHGFSDTRIWDPRNLPCYECSTSDSGNGPGSTGPSGLGRGTIQIAPLSSAYTSVSQSVAGNNFTAQLPWSSFPFQFSWSVDGNYFAPLIVARPGNAPPDGSPYMAQIQCLFNWAELKYSTSFIPVNALTQWAGAGQGPLQLSNPYVYRYYGTTHSYLGVTLPDINVYYQGSNSAITSEGTLTTWLSNSNCQTATSLVQPITPPP